MSQTGTCALCLNTKADLQSSHYLPAGVYRLCKTVDTPGNSSPLLVTKGTVVQTDYQQKAFLLCSDCEQRFNRFGERWVFANGIQKQMPTFPPLTVDEKTFPFLAKLQMLKPSQSGFGVKVFTNGQVDPIARGALAYFAASMFWRGAVYPWTPMRTYPVRLGPYKEDFRRYLLGQSDFPMNAALTVTVREPGMIWKHTQNPISSRVDRAYVHRFVMPGFVFHLRVGKDLADWIQEICFVRGAGGPVIVGSYLEQGIGDLASGVLNEGDGAAKLQALTQRNARGGGAPPAV